MSTTMTEALIGYDLRDEIAPGVVVVQFETQDITDPIHGQELGEQLDSLICPDLPLNFVLDFRSVRAMGSTGFCEIAAFARRVRWWGGQIKVCNLPPELSLGAALSGLDDHVEFTETLRTAIAMAREDAQCPVFAG